MSSKLVNILLPGTIPERLIQTIPLDERRRRFVMLENQSLVLEAARKMNCSIVNIAPLDLLEGKSNLLYGLLWQILKNGTIMQARLLAQPNLSITEEDGRIQGKNGSSIEASLLNWVNESITSLDSVLQMKDFSKSLIDGKIYSCLLSNYFPHIYHETIATEEEQSAELLAEKVAQMGKRLLGAQCILETEDILTGNETMNLLFIASLCRLISQQKEGGGTQDDLSVDEGHKSEWTKVETDTPTVNLDTLNESLEQLQRAEEGLVMAGEDDPSETGTLNNEGHLAPLVPKRIPMEKVLIELRQRPQHIPLIKEEEGDASIGEGVEGCQGSVLSTSSVPMQAIEKTTSTWSAKDVAGSEAEKESKESLRLERIFHYSKNIIPLLRIIFNNDLSLSTMSRDCIHQGPVAKKTRFFGWSNRYAVIKESFLFIYRDQEAQRPTSVEKLANALVKENEEKTSGNPILAVEICCAVRPHYLYLSMPTNQVAQWTQAIFQASKYR